MYNLGMNKKRFKEICNLEYKGVRAWPSVNLKIHPELVIELDKIAGGMSKSRNEVIYQIIQMTILSRYGSPEDLMRHHMEKASELASEMSGVPKDKVLKDLLNGSSSVK